MAETEVDTYKLNTDDRKQSLRISLINNEQIAMILTNMDSNQRYAAYIALDQLVEVCEAFNSTKNIQEALQLLKETIEAGNIMLTEDPQENTIDLKYSITIENEEYPAFDVKLELEQGENNGEDDVQILPPTFDYQGNSEAENKYGKTMDNTTEFEKPIIQSNVKPPILQLEYIEPILQVHYPDGTTKSHALPPRIQGADGKVPDITEEQFQSIREQMNRNSTIQNFSPLKDFLNNNRSNSVAKKNVSAYSTQSTPYPGANISRVNAFQNAQDGQNQAQFRHTAYNNIPNMYNYLNSDMNKTSSGYSTMTMQARPYPDMYSAQIPNPTLVNNNLNNANLFQKSKILNQGIMERRPRMAENHPRDATRSQSTPSHENMKRFDPNKNPDIYQPNPTDNPYQNRGNFNGNEKYPYDRNTQRLPNRNRNKNNEKMPHNHRRQKNLAEIQKHQQKLEEVQKKLAEIQKQQKELQARQLEIHQKKQLALNNRQFNNKQNLNQKQLLRAMPNQPNRQFLQNQQSQQIKKTQLQSMNANQQQMFQSQEIRKNNLLNKRQQQGIQQKSSQEIKQSKALMNKNPAPFKTQLSSPIPDQTSDISQKLISLAQMASMQNEANPNLKNVQAFTLEQIEKGGENTVEQEEVHEYQPQVEEETQQQQQQYEQEAAAAEEEQPQGDMNIEALFFTEDGRVIFRNGLLRGIIHKYVEIDEVVSKIQDILQKGVKFNLVYKAFDIWDQAKDFHERCDKLNMSLVLIETDKDVRFGGFTTQSWEGHCLKKKDNNAFVFSLDRNKIYDIIPNEPAIGCYPKFGPVFFGCQIRIYDNFFTKGGTTCHRGLNYRTTEDYELNNGEQKFLIKDIEVYSIETIDI